MNIGEVARQSGVNAKMIRHYESLGLIPRAKRSAGGYRVYSSNDVHTLRFVKRARDLGFSMVEIKKLLGLWKNRTRRSAEVRALAQAHIEDLEKKISDLQAMSATLRNLVKHCHGDHRPDCPILDELASCKACS